MTRHASMADQLKALLAYRNRPEGPIETVKTNWKTIAANDNNPEDLDGLYIERERPIRPRLGEIMESVKSKYVEHSDDGKIIRIGKLRFSDGTQTEKAHRYSVDGKLIEYDAVMPIGAMLGTSEKQERILGGDTISSNGAYTAAYGGRHPNKVRRKDKDKRASEKPAPERSKADMRAEIASLPSFPVKMYKKGFPWKPSNLRELFMGLEKGRKGESGSVAWEDISTHIVEREVWAETMAALSNEDKVDLDKVMTADNVSDFGGTGHRRTNERRGKRRLKAMNDNFYASYKKSAA
ncbi:MULTISPECIES: hypothetical protein [unclassified Mesorhizobium]|uniref:hypothetical protein n=1 Tax=unclassified Mesorhizobium TaxID=325217 RepID=UPI00112907CF|nr:MULTISPECIES: hypothetical protein [unclassified Mesorhizobium]TPJ86942.1 hypothetical protein FJ489_30785 [Mesorhizobium sp. B2-5-12]TPK19165.1 hypothetical protein FJ562_31190 [Mesorhizobium sp. B2-5-6]